MLQTAEFLLQKQVAEALAPWLGPLPPRYLQQSQTSELSRILNLQQIHLDLQQNDFSAPAGEVSMLQIGRDLQHNNLSEAARKVSGRRGAVDLQHIPGNLQQIKAWMLPIPLELQQIDRLLQHGTALRSPESFRGGVDSFCAMVPAFFKRS